MMEAINVNLTVDRTYHLLEDFFSSQSDLKVKSCSEPSLIKVKKTEYLRYFSSFYVNIRLNRKEEGVSIEFDFDFSSIYAVIILLVIIGTIVGIIVAIYTNESIGFLIAFPIFLISIVRMPEDTRKLKDKFMKRIVDYFKDIGVKVYI